MQKKCPNCGKVYETDFPTREEAVANGGNAIQREQHQTGICSDKCWDEFLGIAWRSNGPQMFPKKNIYDDMIGNASPDVLRYMKEHYGDPRRFFEENEVEAYIKYYNLDRLHTSNGDLSPVEYENLAN